MKSRSISANNGGHKMNTEINMPLKKKTIVKMQRSKKTMQIKPSAISGFPPYLRKRFESGFDTRL